MNLYLQNETLTPQELFEELDDVLSRGDGEVCNALIAALEPALTQLHEAGLIDLNVSTFVL